MTLYSFAVMDEETQTNLQGVLGFVEVAPNNITAILALAAPDASDEVIDNFNEMFYSIALA